MAASGSAPPRSSRRRRGGQSPDKQIRAVQLWLRSGDSFTITICDCDECNKVPETDSKRLYVNCGGTQCLLHAAMHRATSNSHHCSCGCYAAAEVMIRDQKQLEVHLNSEQRKLAYKDHEKATYICNRCWRKFTAKSGQVRARSSCTDAKHRREHN